MAALRENVALASARMTAKNPLESSLPVEGQMSSAASDEGSSAADGAAASVESRHANLGVEQGAAIQGLSKPVYPARAIRLGQEGTVVVEVEVLSSGSTGKVVVRQSSGHRLLDDAAVRAAGACRFTPAMRDGQRVVSLLTIPFRFALRDAANG